MLLTKPLSKKRADSLLPPLGELGILVFTLDASLIQEQSILNQFRSFLDQDEQTRYSQFILEDLCHTYLVTRGIIRFILGYYTHRAPEAISFGLSPNGKPFLSHSQGIEFSLSHSGSHIALAVGRSGKIGIDIEVYQRPAIPLKELAENCFSPKEFMQWQLLSKEKGETEQIQNFTRIWTLKEAYLKAVGTGLRKPLKSFSVEMQPEGGITLDDKEGVSNWQFFISGENENYPLALVYESSPGEGIKDISIQPWDNRFFVDSAAPVIEVKK